MIFYGSDKITKRWTTLTRSILTPLQVNSAEPSKSKTTMQITYIPSILQSFTFTLIWMSLQKSRAWVLPISDEIFLKCKQSVIFHIKVWPVSRLIPRITVNTGMGEVAPGWVLEEQSSPHHHPDLPLATKYSSDNVDIDIESLCTNLYKYPNQQKWRKEWRIKEDGNKNEKYDRVWCHGAEQSIPKQSKKFFFFDILNVFQRNYKNWNRFMYAL